MTEVDEESLRLAEAFEEEHHVICFDDNGEMLIREGPIHVKGAEARIAEFVNSQVPKASEHLVNETVAKLRRRNYRNRLEADSQSVPYLAMENEILDVREKQPSPLGRYTFDEFYEAHPEIVLWEKLPVRYQPKAIPRRFLDFLQRFWPNPDDQLSILEHIAAALDRTPRKRPALCLFGEPDTGKTTLFKVIEKFFGSNLEDITLQDLCGGDKWAKAKLYHRMAVMHDDITDMTLIKVGDFKAATGGGIFQGQEKYKTAFTFHPYAWLFYSGNKRPDLKSVHDLTDDAFWTRIKQVDCTVKVPEEEKVDNFWESLATPEELSGILNVCLGILNRQMTEGRLSRAPIDPAFNASKWAGEAEPALAFLKQRVYALPENSVPKIEIIQECRVWAHRRKLPLATDKRLSQLIRQVYPGVREGVKKEKDGHSYKAWLGIALKDRAQTEIATDSTAVGHYSPLQSTERRRGFNQNAVESVALGLQRLFGAPK